MSNMDLSSIFNLQQNYLTGLTASAGNLSQTDTANLSTMVSSVQNQLDALNTGFNQANISGNQILDHQTDMSNIVDTEKTRLLLKKQNVDNALEGKNRAIHLNESYRQRYSHYTHMVMIITFTLAIIVLLTLLSVYFPVIPSFVTSLLSFIIGLIAAIYCYFIYTDIQRRDILNFNELNLSGPNILTPEQIAQQQKASAASGNLLGTLNLGSCVGASCCSGDTVWDPITSSCLTPADVTMNAAAALLKANATSTPTPSQQPFTTLADAYGNNNMKNVSANSPNEFEGYSNYSR